MNFFIPSNSFLCKFIDLFETLLGPVVAMFL